MTTMAATRTRARQLDIIADTALAADPRLAAPRGSSSVGSKGSHPGVRQASQSPRGSSSVDPRIVEINKRREDAKISNEQFARRAGISFWTWRDLRRGSQSPTAVTIAKLQAAFEERCPQKPIAIIEAFHLMVMQQLAIQLRFDVEVLLATDFSVQRPSNSEWLQAARIRQMAIYITTVELQISNADLGRALGTTRANIKFARDAIENRREDGNEVDMALNAVTLQVRRR